MDVLWGDVPNLGVRGSEWGEGLWVGEPGAVGKGLQNSTTCGLGRDMTLRVLERGEGCTWFSEFVGNVEERIVSVDLSGCDGVSSWKGKVGDHCPVL